MLHIVLRSSWEGFYNQPVLGLTVSSGHFNRTPRSLPLTWARFLPSFLHKHTGRALGSGLKQFYTSYPFLMITQQPFNLQIHHCCPPPTSPRGDLSLLLLLLCPIHICCWLVNIFRLMAWNRTPGKGSHPISLDEPLMGNNPLHRRLLIGAAGRVIDNQCRNHICKWPL